MQCCITACIDALPPPTPCYIFGIQGKLWDVSGSHQQVPEALSPATSRVWESDADNGSALELGLLLWAPVAEGTFYSFVDRVSLPVDLRSSCLLSCMWH